MAILPMSASSITPSEVASASIQRSQVQHIAQCMGGLHKADSHREISAALMWPGICTRSCMYHASSSVIQKYRIEALRSVLLPGKHSGYWRGGRMNRTGDSGDSDWRRLA
jgi:hypothetical protein